MTEEQARMIQRVHDFWFVPPLEGKPTRAEQTDEILAAVRAGKIGTRIVLWLAGLVIAVGAAVAVFKSGGVK